jgi:regulatory protein YycI of two-component signal transduction system YycFG
MEWGRAKTILILSFLVLNLVLAYQLWLNNMQMEGSEFESAEIAGEIQELLEINNIQLNTEVPEETPRLKEITVRFEKQMPKDQKIELTQPVTDNVILNKADIKDVLATQIFKANDYQLDPLHTRPGLYTMNQMYNGLPLFEVNLFLFYEQEEIKAYSQSYVEVEHTAMPQEQRVLSAYMAIGNLAENYLPGGSVIKEIRLGYHGQIYNSETQVLAPFWRIAIRNGDIYYVHAITGAVEVPQKGKSK